MRAANHVVSHYRRRQRRGLCVCGSRGRPGRGRHPGVLPAAGAGRNGDRRQLGIDRVAAGGRTTGAQSVIVKVSDVRGLYALQQYRRARCAADHGSRHRRSTASGGRDRNRRVEPDDGRDHVEAQCVDREGSVLSQNPEGGSSAAPATPVGFVVSLGPPPVGVVPNVVGLHRQARNRTSRPRIRERGYRSKQRDDRGWHRDRPEPGRRHSSADINSGEPGRLARAAAG